MKTIIFSLFFTLMLVLNTQLSAASGGVSKQQAVAIATQSHPGRVLAVKRKANVYQIKILSDSGKVRVIKVDIENGNIVSGSASH
jgi:uncharacterized membrane protein YkoI